MGKPIVEHDSCICLQLTKPQLGCKPDSFEFAPGQVVDCSCVHADSLLCGRRAFYGSSVEISYLREVAEGMGVVGAGVL